MPRKTIFVRELRAKDTVRTTFLVRNKELVHARNGKPYLNLLLGDSSGAVDSRVWEGAEALAAGFQAGDVVAVQGRAQNFQNRMQLVIEHLTPIPKDQVEMDDYMPKAEGNVEQMYEELLELFRGLSCPWTRDLGLRLLQDPEIAERYKLCPAAKTIHHAFLGGLLTHSLQLIKLAEAVLPFYPTVNRDYVIFGAAFHDFGKIFELSFDSDFNYTDEGKLVGHIAIGVSLIDRKVQGIPGFPPSIEWQLKHLVLSHHGKLEYGSPKRPHTLEAELVHQLDTLDSRMDGIQNHINAEKGDGRWTGHHRAYDQYYYRPDKQTEA